MPLELLKIRVRRQVEAQNFATITAKLDDLTPLEVFQQKCVAHYEGKEPAEMPELEASFRELLENL